MNLVLIGLRGSGKSTVGKLLAQRLRWDFVDTDVLIQERAGKSIKEIFAQDLNWATLVPRLPASGTLTADEMTIKEILAVAPKK